MQRVISFQRSISLAAIQQSRVAFGSRRFNGTISAAAISENDAAKEIENQSKSIGITEAQLEDVIRRHASLEAGAPVPADYALNADLLVKFKVFEEIAELTGRPFTNTELNNATTAADLMALARTPAVKPLVEQRRETIEQKLKTIELPPNMHWVSSQRTLRFRLEDMQRAEGTEGEPAAQ